MSLPTALALTRSWNSQHGHSARIFSAPTSSASLSFSSPMRAAASGSLRSVSTLPQQCASSRLNGSSRKSALGLALMSSRGGSYTPVSYTSDAADEEDSVDLGG